MIIIYVMYFDVYVSEVYEYDNIVVIILSDRRERPGELNETRYSTEELTNDQCRTEEL